MNLKFHSSLSIEILFGESKKTRFSTQNVNCTGGTIS